MRNQVVQTGIDAVVSDLRVEVNPTNAEQEAARLAIALSISSARADIAKATSAQQVPLQRKFPNCKIFKPLSKTFPSVRQHCRNVSAYGFTTYGYV